MLFIYDFFTTWNTFPNGRNIKCYALALLSGSQRLRICKTLLISSPSFDARLQSLRATWPLKPSSGNEVSLDERSMSELRKLYPFSNPTEKLSGVIIASTLWIIFPRLEPAFRSTSAQKLCTRWGSSAVRLIFFGKGFGVKRVTKARLRLLKQRVMIVTEEEKWYEPINTLIL
jgi:hypothetical protein